MGLHFKWLTTLKTSLLSQTHWLVCVIVNAGASLQSIIYLDVDYSFVTICLCIHWFSRCFCFYFPFEASVQYDDSSWLTWALHKRSKVSIWGGSSLKSNWFFPLCGECSVSCYTSSTDSSVPMLYWSLNISFFVFYFTIKDVVFL